MRIRSAVVTDVDALLSLERTLIVAGTGMVQSLEQLPTKDELANRIASAEGASLRIVAELDGALVGSAALKQLAPKRCSHVGMLSVGVHPDFQRRGIGRALMAHLIDHARKRELKRLELCVRSDNHAAQALYRVLGFHHEATRARFIALDDGSLIDDYVMALFVTGTPAASDPGE